MASASQASAEGGLFGFLENLGQPFRAEPAPVEMDQPGPLEMRVRPRRAIRQQTRPRRSDVARGDQFLRQKEAYAKLNPAVNSTWYLQDPTLRKGDLIVMKTGIMVFEGQREPAHEEQDFRPLAEARGIPKAEKLRLGKVAIAGVE